MISNGWKEVSLEDAVDALGDGLHGTPKYNEEGDYYFINGNNLDGSILISENTKKVGHEEYLKYKKDLNDRTILVSINGTLGKVAVYNGEKVVLGKSACYFNVKKNYSKQFVKYVMYSKGFKDYLNTHSTGTTIKNMGLKQMRAFKFHIPQLHEQKAIANILSSLDEKIEVNNQINKKLEEMAQAIFKQWFVDFEFPNEEGKPYKSSGGAMVESELGMIPEGWELKKLNEIIYFIKNPTKSGEHLKDRVYIPIDTMPMKSVVTNAFKCYKEAKSSLVLFEKHDILIGAMRVYFHRVNLASQKGVTRTTTFVLRSKNIIDISYNLFLLNQDSTIEFANSTSKGSTMPYAVWDGGLGTLPICYPSQKIRERFNDIVFPILNQIMAKSRENQLLTEIRNSLLPKLMSGEIRVPIETE